MSLASILYPAPTSRGFDEWTWANYDHHRTLSQMILRQKNVVVAETQIWPVTPNSFQDFLRQHAQWHAQMDAALGVAGVDLESVDFENEKQRAAWFWIHFVSHRNYAQALGGGM